MLVMALLLTRSSTRLFAREPSISSSFSSLLVPADTIYLNRNGKEIRRTGGGLPEKTFIVRTTCTTEDLYGPVANDSSRKQFRGISSSITKKEAKKTETLIRAGKYEEAHASGNLIELGSLALRVADWEHVSKDNGKGDTSSSNNREYGVDTYQDGRRVEKIGEVHNPCPGNTYPAIEASSGIITNTHSHPSGTRDQVTNTCSFDPQPPSGVDIRAVPAGSAYWTVFAMGDKKVYLYNSTGVIAVLKIKRYVR